jgi:hypothetical protein
MNRLKPYKNGKLFVHSRKGSFADDRISKDFLQQFLEYFATVSSEYITTTNDVSFTYKERQLHSIIAPALYLFADAFLNEYPLKRNWAKFKSQEWKDSHGWVDYWASYRKTDFFIEVKHSYLSFKSGQLKSASKHSWKTAHKQLSAIKNVIKLTIN